MRPPPAPGKPKAPRRRVGIFLIVAGLAALLLALLAAPARAAGASLRIDRLGSAAGSMQGLVVQLRESADGRWAVRLQADEARLPALDQVLRDIDWSCEAAVLPGACEGPLRLAGRPSGRLSLDVSEPMRAHWRQGGQEIRLQQQAEAWRIELARLPLRWLASFGQARFGLAPQAGRVSGTLHIPAKAPAHWRAELAVSGFGFDSPDGTRAAAGVGGRIRLRGAADSIAIEARWERGEALFAPFYVVAPKAGIDLGAEWLTGRPDLALRHFHWRDAGTLQLQGRARRAAEGHWSALELALTSADLGALSSRYLEGVLGPAGLAGLVLDGAASARLRLAEGELVEIMLGFDAVNARDPAGRFAVQGLAGGLHWSGREMVESALGWTSAALYGIELDPARLAFRSREGRLELAGPVAIGVLGGQLGLSQLVWQPPQGQRSSVLHFGLALHPIDLGRLSRQFGWPAFEGQIGGALPEARYENGRLVFDGGLRMDLFGGTVRIDDLVLERPFGVAPSLAADLRFDDIDLAPLTRAFGFGEITGRLDGRLRDLRLVDWTPVAFDARLLSDRRWPGRRRISQRAVQDIADLGGSGLVAGLQARLLRTFDDFGYERIAIGCVLRGNVCRMSGIARRGEGYLIVEGRGLPRIEVVGFRRDVDWPMLVERLRIATAGGGVRID